MAFKVMSFNVRLDNPADGDNAWENRKQTVVDIIRKQAPAVVGLQEPHKHQVKFIADSLPNYAWVGKGRCPVVPFTKIGERDCEYNPVFYDTSVFDLQESGTFWLSPTPFLPLSKFPGAAFPRICTFARLRRKSDGRELTFVCTHLDHEGEEPRVKGAELIAKKIATDLAPNNAPLILVGDLNAGSDSQCHAVLCGVLKDASAVAQCCTEGCKANGSVSSFCGFDDRTNGGIIDFIFVRDNVAVKSYGIIDDRQPSGCCASDHRPIVAEVELL